MIKVITVFIFFVAGIIVNVPKSELLNGKWIFKKALNKGIDNLGKRSLKSEVINKMTFEFKSNGEFRAFILSQNMKGTWVLSKDSKVILLNTENEDYEFTVLRLTKTELILKVGLGEFLMKKI
ncbi:hypothetical protein GS399_15635 [Pedobacter sp. HMF7647]|uniref:Lipocalin-like domain-containing protein n=1 Tax=Hufsiella arboris TaxID=2695275 RepID=A0A7K1YCU3_9SPHI|nr:lipocalin family protein [Hufsiella arboris]MXV52406.1 hypothetical protein [Hufsiella arboris]